MYGRPMSPHRLRAPWSQRSWAVAAVTAVALLAAPAGAQAFDTGPHSDITRDALAAEGFGATATDVVVVNNWFVDLYSNSSKIPQSGHADTAVSDPRRVLRERRELAAGRARRREPHALRLVDLGRRERRQGAGRVGPAPALDDAAAAQHQVGRRSEQGAPAALDDRHRPALAPGLLLALQLDRAAGRHRGRRHRLVEAARSGCTPTWFDVPKADARQAQRLHRRVDRAQGPAARRLEHRRQQVDEEGRQQGLARAPRLHERVHDGVLRHPPVGAGDPRRARRRGALAAHAALRQPARGRARPRPQGRARHRDDDRALAGSGRAVRPVVLAERLRIAQRARRRPHRRAQRRQLATSRTAAARASAARSRRSSRCSASRRRTAISSPSPRARACRRPRASCSCGSPR